jgi:hypothetical protein
MIVHAGVTVIGRHEEHTEVSDRYLVDKVSQISAVLYDHLTQRVYDRREEWFGPSLQGFLNERKPSPEEAFWNEWGAVACVGPWDRWDGFMFMALEGLGLTSAPAIVEQWWVTAGGRVHKMRCATGSRALVMHQTSKLLNWKKWPIRGPNKAQARAALEQILRVDGELEALSMHARPDASTKGGLDRALREHNLRLVMPKLNGGAHKMTAVYRLERLPQARTGFAPYGIELDEDAEANQSAQDQAWTTLDGAIRERV